MSKKISSWLDTDFPGKVTIVDRCDKNDKQCSTLPWLITEQKDEFGETKQYLACKKVNLGRLGTSFKAEGCARISCLCEQEEGCDCRSVDYLDISLGGFQKAKKINTEDLTSFDDKTIHKANHEKLRKKGL